MVRTHLAQESWPPAGPAMVLPPGCTTVTLLDDQTVVAALRWWVADGTKYFEPWPGSPETALWPSMVLGEASTPARAEVWFDRPRLDGQDELLARARVAVGSPVEWLQPAPDGLEGLLVRAMAEAVTEQPGTPPALASGEVMALPGSDAGPVHEDLRPRSWHARLGDSMLRALELTPIRDEDDELVARRVQVHRADAPHAAAGLAVWDGTTLRYWPGGVHPMVQPALERGQWSGLERLLLDRVESDWSALPSDISR